MTSPFVPLKHSVCRWCYAELELDELCRQAKQVGAESVELLTTEELPIASQQGLACAMVSPPAAFLPNGEQVGTILKGFNRLEHHDTLVGAYQREIAKIATAGANQLICFSGNRDGLDDATGMENCAIGIRRLLPTAEKYGVRLVMELLNSKIDHPDYMADRSEWGAQLCQEIDHDHFGLLYDVYHMQIMEGDIIATIRKHHRWFFHYHTAGVPGRNELSPTQELNYPAIMQAIRDSGYQGFIGHEIIPTLDRPIDSLKQAIELCSTPPNESLIFQ